MACAIACRTRRSSSGFEAFWLKKSVTTSGKSMYSFTTTPGSAFTRPACSTGSQKE